MAATRQQSAKKAAEASKFEGRGKAVSPWKDPSLFSPAKGDGLKNSLVMGTPVKPKVKVLQETAQAKVEANEPLVKAAYVLKSKKGVRGLSYDPRRPLVSLTKCDESSGEEEGAVGDEEPSQSNDEGGSTTGMVVAMAGDELIEVAKNGE